MYCLGVFDSKLAFGFIASSDTSAHVRIRCNAVVSEEKFKEFKTECKKKFVPPVLVKENRYPGEFVSLMMH